VSTKRETETGHWQKTVHWNHGEATVEIEIISWEGGEDGGAEPMVLLTLVWRGDSDHELISGVWQWSTDHYLDYIRHELPDYLKAYCPAPDEVWESLVRSIPEELFAYWKTE
jgi:hypothetical protein